MYHALLIVWLSINIYISEKYLIKKIEGWKVCMTPILPLVRTLANLGLTILAIILAAVV